MTCDHIWVEKGDGHNHDYWLCRKCDKYSWIAPWLLKGNDGQEEVS